MVNLELASPDGGLTPGEVRQRVQAGLVNEVQERPSRTTGEIVRANIVTRFNILLGALLLIVLIVLQQPRDALFGLVLVINSAIGIIQELRAKRTLDRLELLAAPRVRLVRSGRITEQAVDRIVVDDLIDLRSGDQLVVDGVVITSNGLEIDESLLTGESDPVVKEPDDGCLSGSFVAAGSGQYRATRVGAESYAAKLAHAAKRFKMVRSELRDGINRILGLVSWVVVPMGALLVWSSLRGGLTFEEGLRGAVAAGVAMVPQGLVLLTSMAFAVGVSDWDGATFWFRSSPRSRVSPGSTPYALTRPEHSRRGASRSRRSSPSPMGTSSRRWPPSLRPSLTPMQPWPRSPLPTPRARVGELKTPSRSHRLGSGAAPRSPMKALG